MYESPALLVLFLTQLLLLAVMFSLSFYLKKHLTVSFAEKLVWAVQDRPFIWKLKAQNSGKLPVSRFALKVRAGRKTCGRRQKGKAWERSTVYGYSGGGEMLLSFEKEAPHCGIFTYCAYRLKVFDYLSLFSRNRRLNEEMSVVVFPREYRMKIETAYFFRDGGGTEQQNIFLAGNDYEEIRQLREYRDGDSVRHIHWNQTAKTGSLWVKEYSAEMKVQIRLFLDLDTAEKDRMSDRDAFYTLLLALLSGLLETASAIRVCWKEKENPGLSEALVTDRAQCGTLLYRLYQAEEDQRFEQRGNNTGINMENTYGDMRLTGDLSWYVGERLVFRFAGDKLEEDLARRTFRI